MYNRANLDYKALLKLSEELQGLSEFDLVEFNRKSNEMPWESACTVRLYANAVYENSESPTLVERLLKTLNSLTQENLSFLAKETSKMNVGLAYTFTLPPPPPNGGG